MPGSRSSKNRRAIVIGGSMSGLFSAAFLRRVGWDCDVYERSGVELVGRGAGITTHPELLEVLANYAGYYIWRGAPNEADLSPQTLKEIFPYFVFYLPPRQEVITYPIAGFNDDLRPGHRRYNFIWYRVADAAQLRAMNVDA